MNYYRSRELQHVLGVLLDANAIISVTEDQEKELLIGKYAPTEKEIKANPKTPRGNQMLVKLTASQVRDLGEGEAIDEGLVVYPPPKAINLGKDRPGPGPRESKFDMAEHRGEMPGVVGRAG